MKSNAVCADAPVQSDVAAVLTQNRQVYVEAMLDLKAWEELSAKIAAYKPDYVISAARKMPRLVSLLQSLPHPIFDFDAVFVSDFAIEFLNSELSGKRIAILDDSLNVGSTFGYILKRASKYHPQEIKCFCLTRKQDGGRALPPGTRLECAYSEPIKEATYKKNATKLAMGLWMINRPLECEFPVFALRNLPQGWLENLEEELNHWGKDYPFFSVNMPDAANYGFKRFSVGIHANNNLNEKVRLYVDSLNNELVIVPMAFSCSPSENPTDRLRERFLSSLSLAREFFTRLQMPSKPQLLSEEATLLFGPQEAMRLTNLWREDRLSDRHVSNLTNNLPNTFYDKEWPKIKLLCKIADARFLNACFVAVLNAVALFYEAESGTDYKRLCKGPTYGELILILRDLWKTSRIGLKALPNRLGQLLDEQIDNGFVVPMTDSQGRRVFRKGEPYAWQRLAKEILRFVVGDFHPADDLRTALDHLEIEDRERFITIMLRLEGITSN